MLHYLHYIIIHHMYVTHIFTECICQNIFWSYVTIYMLSYIICIPIYTICMLSYDSNIPCYVHCRLMSRRAPCWLKASYDTCLYMLSYHIIYIYIYAIVLSYRIRLLLLLSLLLQLLLYLHI